MGLRIVTKSDVGYDLDQQAAAKGGKRTPQDYDGYLGRLVKYVPAPAVAAFLTINGTFRAQSEPERFAAFEWVVFAILCLGTIVIAWAATRKGRIPRWRQVIVSPLAFAVWVLAIGGPFTNLSWYEELYGQVLVPIITFIVPAIDLVLDR